TDEAERARGAPGNRPPGGAGALRRVVQRGPDGVGQPVRRARFLRLVRLLAGTNRRGDRPGALGHRGAVRGESVVAHRQRGLPGRGGPECEPGGAGGVLRRAGLGPAGAAGELPAQFRRAVRGRAGGWPGSRQFRVRRPAAAGGPPRARGGNRGDGHGTTPEEAVALAEGGVDVVVATGAEAAGHRAAFLRDAETSLMGTFAL